MSRRFTLITLALSTSVAFLVGVIIAGGMSRTPVVLTEPAVKPPITDRPRPARAPAGSSASVVNFADVAERINAAVVNIEATSKASVGRETPRLLRPDDSLDGPGGIESPRQGSGSGFVVDSAGFILTNNHVIEGAERITVTLADGRAFRGEVVGADPAIDVALVRIPEASNLPAAPLGNSDELRPGEWVCAIGNPLGYVHSVTVGVVSFIGRKLFDLSLDDYIQTDAAINFGNSGGPLINSRGEVVGINSAISSKASNIGFAVPINQAVAILPQLKTRGRVSRGFIGVALTDVTPSLQRALALTVSEGALVQDVTPRSPAERAGLRAYDVIVQVEGRPVVTNQELIRDIAARQPGSVARLEVVRDGGRHALTVKLAERPARGEEFDSSLSLDRPVRQGAREPEAPPALGVTVRELDRAFVGRQEIPDSVQGVIVSSVDPTGPAHQALRRGYVIMEINRRPARSVVEFDRLVSTARPGDVLAIYYYAPALSQRALVTVVVD